MEDLVRDARVRQIGLLPDPQPRDLLYLKDPLSLRGLRPLCLILNMVCIPFYSPPLSVMVFSLVMNYDIDNLYFLQNENVGSTYD